MLRILHLIRQPLRFARVATSLRREALSNIIAKIIFERTMKLYVNAKALGEGRRAFIFLFNCESSYKHDKLTSNTLPPLPYWQDRSRKDSYRLPSSLRYS